MEWFYQRIPTFWLSASGIFADFESGVKLLFSLMCVCIISSRLGRVWLIQGLF